MSREPAGIAAWARVVRFGLGLGLGIAHTIVHDHSGTIGLESRPGRTVFEVRLPAMEEER